MRQGSGLDEARNLTPEAMRRGWDCLACFAERLADFRRPQVRTVATQTLREARNGDAFIARALAEDVFAARAGVRGRGAPQSFDASQT